MAAVSRMAKMAAVWQTACRMAKMAAAWQTACRMAKMAAAWQTACRMAQERSSGSLWWQKRELQLYFRRRRRPLQRRESGHAPEGGDPWTRDVPGPRR